MPKLVDPKIDFDDIKVRCVDLESRWSEYKNKADRMEAAYLLDWTDGPSATDARVVVSPTARNKALGMINMMLSDPEFSVPFDANELDAQSKADKVEKFIKAMWSAAGRVRQRPVHYDIVTSAVLFGRVDMAVMSTVDMLANAQCDDNPAGSKRIEQIANIAPFLFEVYDPRTGYPEYDSFGLASYYRKITLKSGEVLDKWGDAAIVAGLDPVKRTVDVSYCEYWDSIIGAAWVEGKNPMMCREHGLPCIPIVSQIVTGSTLFSTDSDRVQPFLQTIVDSGIWAAENLTLSAMATYTETLGIPTFNAYVKDPSKSIRIEKSVIGAVNYLEVGEEVRPLVQKVIDDSILQLHEVSSRLSEDSTIPAQTMGTPVGSNASYSVTALLHQAGRVTLTQIQNMVGWSIGRAVEVALMILRDVAGTSRAMSSNGVAVKLIPSDVPKAFILNCIVKPDLPQDKRQDAMVAQQLSAGDNPMVSVRWARENILGIGQSKDMTSEIWSEKFAQMEAMQQYQQDVQSMMARAQASPSMSAQAQGPMGQLGQMGQMGQQPGQPQPQMPPDMMQGAPPEMLAQMQGQAPGVGLPAMPLSEPLSPEQMGQAPR